MKCGLFKKRMLMSLCTGVWKESVGETVCERGSDTVKDGKAEAYGIAEWASEGEKLNTGAGTMGDYQLKSVNIRQNHMPLI